ncbi:MAG: hypothetical protein EB059_10265, partial [Alphaproteobacteria bacterium]|nr:hypothetical protein [Alphaproteobacteria bacterium]
NQSSDERLKHPLTFFNYKDGNEYDVAVKGFVLRRTAENPMLYYYSITLRAYNMRSVGANTTAGENINERLTELGLGGVKSSPLLSDIKDIAGGVKGALGALSGGLNVFGR